MLRRTRQQADKIYNIICQDERHTQLELTSYDEISEREFVDWSMGYMPEMDLTDELNLKYSGSKAFYPYEMSGESCHYRLAKLVICIPVYV